MAKNQKYQDNTDSSEVEHVFSFLYQFRFLHDWNRYKTRKLQIAA